MRRRAGRGRGGRERGWPRRSETSPTAAPAIRRRLEQTSCVHPGPEPVAARSTPAIEFLRKHGSTPQRTCRLLICRANSVPFILEYTEVIYPFKRPSRPHKKTSDRTKAGAKASRGARAGHPNPHRRPPPPVVLVPRTLRAIAGAAGRGPTAPPPPKRPRIALESSPNRPGRFRPASRKDPASFPEGSRQLPASFSEGSRQDPAPVPAGRARLEISTIPDRRGGFSPPMGRLARLPHPFLQKIG